MILQIILKILNLEKVFAQFMNNKLKKILSQKYEDLAKDKTK